MKLKPRRRPGVVFVKRKAKCRKVRPVAKPAAIFKTGCLTDGYALVHRDGTISLASIRSNPVMVDSLAKVFDVAGYRIARVRVVELT